MKLINSIKEWCERKLTCDMAALITFIVAMVLQIVFAIFIPCFVLKLEYDASNVCSSLLLILFSGCVLFNSSMCFYTYMVKHFKTATKKVVIVISVILVSIGTVLPGIKALDDNLFPTRDDYDVLMERAEEVECEDDLYEYADYFSWSKRSGNYCADFYMDELGVEVTYDENFEITECNWTNSITVTIFIFILLIALAELLTMAISSIVFAWYKFVDKMMKKIKDKKNK